MTQKEERKKVKLALKLLRTAIDEAEKGGCLQVLWNLIATLRGPDDDDSYSRKRQYTEHIRGMVMTAKQALTLGADCAAALPPDPRPDTLPQRDLDWTTHWWSHVRYVWSTWYRAGLIEKEDAK